MIEDDCPEFLVSHTRNSADETILFTIRNMEDNEIIGSKMI